MPSPSRRLLLSIHDVGPRFESEVDRLRDLIGQSVPDDRIALLVVPDHWGAAPIVPGSAFATRLRGWADRGAEIFLHGWSHRDDTQHVRRSDRFRASRLTAGEGEFLGLSHAGARFRMLTGKALIEGITGREVAGFIAPAWLYGAGAAEALTSCGFALAEDHWKVWDPRSGAVLSRSPVLTWASRTPTRIASSLFAAWLLQPLLARLPVARVGVHPGDVGVPALLDSIRQTIRQLSATHRFARYEDLLTAKADACA